MKRGKMMNTVAPIHGQRLGCESGIDLSALPTVPINIGFTGIGICKAPTLADEKITIITNDYSHIEHLVTSCIKNMFEINKPLNKAPRQKSKYY